MKVLIDIDDVKKFIDSRSEHVDEWYGKVNEMTADCIIDFLDWAGKSKASMELYNYVYEGDNK